MDEKIPFVKTVDGGIYCDDCYENMELMGEIKNPEKTEQLAIDTEELVICDHCN